MDASEWPAADDRLSDPIDALVADRREHAPDRPPVIVARTTERVGDAIATLQAYGVSQPSLERPEGDEVATRRVDQREGTARPRVSRPVGRGPDRGGGDGPPLPLVDAGATLDEAFALLSDTATGLVVVRGGRPVGVVTKLDVLEYLAHHSGTGG